MAGRAWGRDVALAESPFAGELGGDDVRAQPGQLPESWLGAIREAGSSAEELAREGFLDGAGETAGAGALDSPFTSGSWAEVTSDVARWAGRLEWPGASTEQLAFMQAVYDKHAALSRAAGGTFTADLPDAQLRVVEGRHRAQKEAAEQAIALLRQARADLAAAGLGTTVRIGIVSAYRPASEQFLIWQGKDRSGGFPYYYRQMLQRGALRAGDLGPAAVTAMARYLGGWIAAPGYSNHQDGLAIDFGTGAAGGGLGKIGSRSWFHQWLVKNAHRFGFQPYEREAWHWTYRGVAAGARPAASTAATAAPVQGAFRTEAQGITQLVVPRVPLLAAHRGTGPDLVLRWNVPAAPEVVDVVVHLHGYWMPGMVLTRDVLPVSGIDLAPIAGVTGQGRTRPTLAVLPRGHDTGVRQKVRRKDGSLADGPYDAFTFPQLVTEQGLTELVRFALDRFAAETHAGTPRLGRLILTAHSGGGAPLLKILRHHDPQQIHVFDALYQDAGALVAWARRHIRADRAALQTIGTSSAGEYMTTRGGGLRVLYQGQVRGGTRPFSRAVLRELSGEIGPELAARYRVEASRYDHFQIPRRYGWRLLADAAADLPDTYVEPVVQAEAEAMPWEPPVVGAEEVEAGAFEDERLDDERLDDELLDPELLDGELVETLAEGEEPEAEQPVDLSLATDAYEAMLDRDEAMLDRDGVMFAGGDVEAADEAGMVSERDLEGLGAEEGESGDVETAEAEAYLAFPDAVAATREEETGSTVTFPSGATLTVVSGPTAPGQEHFDPVASGNPLLDTGATTRSTLLSANFTVGELARSGGRAFDKARIDPDLVRCLQALRDAVGRSVTITSGYRPYAYNETLYRDTYQKTPTKSRHSSGQAADVRIAGMSGTEIAKAAIDACGTEIGVGIAATYAHVDVRGTWARWTYFGTGTERERLALAEIEAYRRARRGAGSHSVAPPPAAPSAETAARLRDALGRGLWDTAVRIAIGSGITDEHRLTDTLFFLRYPERRGIPIRPQESELLREWRAIRDRWVRPALHSVGDAGTTAPSPGPEAPPGMPGTPTAAKFTRAIPAKQRFAALVPLLDRHRADIPLAFLLGWIDVESNGRIDVITNLDERGFFQIHPAESKDRAIDHARLTTDPEYSVQAGLQIIRTYADLARRRFPWAPPGSELFWRIVKLQHAMGSPLARAMLVELQARGGAVPTWEAIRAFERTDPAQRLHKLLRVRPGRFGENVDAVFDRGARIARSVGR